MEVAYLVLRHCLKSASTGMVHNVAINEVVGELMYLHV
jgi:hypothetical protein